MLGGFIPTDVVLVVGQSLSGKTSFCKLFMQQQQQTVWLSSIPQTQHIFVDCLDDVLIELRRIQCPLKVEMVVVDNLTHLLDAQHNTVRYQDLMNTLLVEFSRFENALILCTSLKEYSSRFASIVVKLINSQTALTVKLEKSIRHCTPNQVVLPKSL